MPAPPSALTARSKSLSPAAGLRRCWRARTRINRLRLSPSAPPLHYWLAMRRVAPSATAALPVKRRCVGMALAALLAPRPARAAGGGAVSTGMTQFKRNLVEQSVDTFDRQRAGWGGQSSHPERLLLTGTALQGEGGGPTHRPVPVAARPEPVLPRPLGGCSCAISPRRGRQ